MTRRATPRPDGGAARPSYRAPALEKGLDILELMAGVPEGLGQAEIARRLGRSVGEIFRMLACLVERGYLAVRRPGAVYVVTERVRRLAGPSPDDADGRRRPASGGASRDDEIPEKGLEPLSP